MHDVLSELHDNPYIFNHVIENLQLQEHYKLQLNGGIHTFLYQLHLHHAHHYRCLAMD